MTLPVAILVPVLNRPHLVPGLLAGIDLATPAAHTVLFLTDPADAGEREAIRAAGGCELACGGTYAAKVNAGVRATNEPLVFLAADDLVPQAGWLEAAARHIEAGAHVVGVNDLLERPHRTRHATHFLMTREYAERPTIDGDAGPCCTQYRHSFTDDELIATAQHRGVYVYAEDSRVRHDHWMNGAVEIDSTYRKGLDTFRLDRKTFRSRQHLFGG